MATPTEPARLVTLDDVRQELELARSTAYDAYRSAEEMHARLATALFLLSQLGEAHSPTAE